MKRSQILAHKKWFWPVLSGACVFLILLAVFLVSGYAPFGGKSLTVFDADIQYLDFFAYLKDVLAGKNDVAYTFSKTLGGNSIAVFSYYLASPFNLLVILFSKADLISFFDITILLKITLSAITMAIFLRERFRDTLQAFPKRNIFILILSIGYALSQYPLAQSNGIMWLDAVYLLPLILLGVFRLITSRRSSLLSIAVALAILFNWYTGAIACIFTVGWFFIEYALSRKRVTIKDFILTTLHFILAMGIGVAVSCILFLPTLGALGGGNRSVLETDRLFDFSFIGDILPGILVKYRPGALSAMGYVSLYCGIISAVGIFGAFLSPNLSWRKKIIFCIILLLVVAIFYWNPFVMLFSLLKNVDTYWYRYSFVGIFALLFIAAQFYLRKRPLKFQKRVFAVLLCGIAIGDAFLNAFLIYRQYSVENVESYHSYSLQATEQADAIRDYDDGTFRVSQTSNRGNADNPYGLTPNYNEALAYNFWSISGYTSSPDDIQRNFLHRVGYHINGENMCITNASVLGVDSLLGVKYIWSAYPINGLDPVEELGEYNGKIAYKNPFALPLAWVSEARDIKPFDGEYNPFEYQNSLFFQLSGDDIKLYKKLKYTLENGVYKVSIPEGNYSIYANLEWSEFFDEAIDVNHAYKQPYAQWLTPSIFYIPTRQGDTSAEVILASNDIQRVREAQFYALDLDVLNKTTEELQDKPKASIIRNGYVEFDTTVDAAGNMLFTTIPFDKGWEILLNGERITPGLFGDTFYTFTLQEGNNHIEMIYHPPRQRAGIAVFSIGILGIFLMFMIERRRGRIRGIKDEEFTEDVV